MISFNRIRNLPVLIPGPKHMSDDECVETDIMGCHIIVSHEYMPIYGPVINVSISGNNAGRDTLVEAFSQEFGIILSKHQNNEKWYYQWPSNVDVIPTTSVQEVLGKSRIDQLCQKHELSVDDKKVLLDLIVQFSLLKGKYEARTAYMEEVTMSMSDGQRENVIATMLEIMIEFVEKQFKKTDKPG